MSGRGVLRTRIGAGIFNAGKIKADFASPINVKAHTFTKAVMPKLERAKQLR